MRLSPKFLFLLCCFLYECNGAPSGKEASTSTHPRGVNFTEEEDKLIIKEISRLPDNDQKRLSSKFLWDHVADKHREKWLQKADGFPQERSSETLRSRFRRMPTLRDPQHDSEVPENLLQRSRFNLNKPVREKGRAYTPEEEELICEELLKPSCTQLNSRPTRERIHAQHHAKWLAMTPGFETERTVESIRWHIRMMKKLGHLPEKVEKKFQTHKKGASGSKSSLPNEQTDKGMEVSDDEDDD